MRLRGRCRALVLVSGLLLGHAGCGKPSEPESEGSSGGEREADDPQGDEREDDRDPRDVVPPLPLAPA
ncbi:MAG: hypothetical protein PVI30_17155 [Myxococcales bacterium]